MFVTVNMISIPILSILDTGGHENAKAQVLVAEADNAAMIEISHNGKQRREETIAFLP